jgi:hypothetical protein
MSKDFMKPQPTKNEKMYFDLMMGMDALDRRVWSTSSFATALAILSKASPKDVAELLTTGQDKIKDFSKKINDEIDKIEEAEKAKSPEGSKGGDAVAAVDEHAGHSHAPGEGH